LTVTEKPKVVNAGIHFFINSAAIVRFDVVSDFDLNCC
jgi:hypothetical protein